MISSFCGGVEGHAVGPLTGTDPESRCIGPKEMQAGIKPGPQNQQVRQEGRPSKSLRHACPDTRVGQSQVIGMGLAGQCCDTHMIWAVMRVRLGRAELENTHELSGPCAMAGEPICVARSSGREVRSDSTACEGPSFFKWCSNE